MVETRSASPQPFPSSSSPPDLLSCVLSPPQARMRNYLVSCIRSRHHFSSLKLFFLRSQPSLSTFSLLCLIISLLLYLFLQTCARSLLHGWNNLATSPILHKDTLPPIRSHTTLSLKEWSTLRKTLLPSSSLLPFHPLPTQSRPSSSGWP
jgi:hypothetical protein